ncbi:MAG TPA: carbonic anhydrase [Gammaproteobacteria bacterium]|jgi:carbonic anhydrase|nr:carbonic anhydrase [Gammaproteobacteria bacterium]
MQNSLNKLLKGYETFRDKYVNGDVSVMPYLSYYGQSPQVMVVACCDSRVDPALILQCDPGDLFVVRNVANIVPPYEIDDAHHGTSAALEFGVGSLEVKHLILLGHSQCGGIQTLMAAKSAPENDFISNWVSIINTDECDMHSAEDCAKSALKQSYQNCLTFPWIKKRVESNVLQIHLWFFDIESGQIYTYSKENDKYQPLG